MPYVVPRVLRIYEKMNGYLDEFLRERLYEILEEILQLPRRIDGRIIDKKNHKSQSKNCFFLKKFLDIF